MLPSDLPERLGVEQKAVDYIREFYGHASPINGAGGLQRFLQTSTYADWLAKVARDLDIANIPPDRVPGYTYFYVRETDDRIVGMINIRLALNAFLREEGGTSVTASAPRNAARDTEPVCSAARWIFCKPLAFVRSSSPMTRQASPRRV